MSWQREEVWETVRCRIGEGNGTPLQHSCLENPMDGGAWWAAVHGVAKSRTRLSDFTFTFHFHALEKEMATQSSVLAWRIPGTCEPGGLPSMGSHSRTRLKRLSSSSRYRIRKKRGEKPAAHLQIATQRCLQGPVPSTGCSGSLGGTVCFLHSVCID